MHSVKIKLFYFNADAYNASYNSHKDLGSQAVACVVQLPVNVIVVFVVIAM